MKNKWIYFLEFFFACIIIASAGYLIYTNVNQPDKAEAAIEDDIVPIIDSMERVDIDEQSADNQGMVATELVQNLRIGWNLGNALECYDDSTFSNRDGDRNAAYYETLWGTTVTTDKLIETVSEAGFNAIRIPITYKNHIDGNSVIDPEWLARIKELVDTALAENMYCIINLHHDTGTKGWIMASAENKEETMERFRLIWAQIADYFQDYDQKLIFEGFNEMVNPDGQWENADVESYTIVNEYNQLFVDTVRKGNGFNSDRCLVVNTYAANSSETTINNFLLPTDTTENRIIVSVHNYEGTDQFTAAIMRLVTKFHDDGIPVIIGEMGMINQEGRDAYVKKILEVAREQNIVCFWWDDASHLASAEEVYNYALINRKTYEWYFPDLMKIIMDTYH